MNNMSSNAIKLLDASLCSWYPVGPLLPKLLGYQSVRWMKPRWVPKAPSKLYVVTHRRRLPPDENKEVLRLYQNWKCSLRLTYEHLHKENLKNVEFGQLSTQVLEEEEKEHQKLMEYNEKENERIKILRNERLEKEKEEIIRSIKEFKILEAKKAEKNKQKAKERLKEIEELVVTFIAKEDLQKAIEHAIDNPTDYNFSIDENGKQYVGRNTLPHLVDPDTVPTFPVKDEGLTNIF